MLSLRRAISLGAAAGAVVATAAAPASAAATTECANPVVYDWAVQAPSSEVASFAIAGIDVTPSASFEDLGSDAESLATVSSGSLGGDDGYVELFHPGGDAGRSTIFELSFEHPVSGVRFQILDVDSYEAGFRDVLRVTAWNGDASATESITGQIGVGALVTASPDGAFRGVATAANDDRSANVSVAIPGPIDRLAFHHVDGGGPDGRITGIGDISVCGAQIGAALGLEPIGTDGGAVRMVATVENLGGVPLRDVTVRGDVTGLVGSVADGVAATVDQPARVDIESSSLAVALEPADLLVPGERRVISIQLAGVAPELESSVQVTAAATSAFEAEVNTSDLSDEGMEPDTDGDGDPSSRFEDDPTLVGSDLIAPLPVPPSGPNPVILIGSAVALVVTIGSVVRRPRGDHVARREHRRDAAATQTAG